MTDRAQPLSRSNWLQLLGGGAMMFALQFGSANMVLVWIGNHRAVSYLLLAMLVPAFQVGFVASQFGLAPQIARLALRKRMVVTSAGISALLSAFVALAADDLGGTSLGLAMLACTLALGLTFGVFSVASTDLLAKTTPQQMRGKLLTLRATFGGLLTLTATILLSAAIPDSVDNQVLFVWISGFAWLGAAFAYGGVLEAPSGVGSREAGWMTIERARELFATHVWLVRYLVLRFLLLSVELAIPFYAIHVSTLSEPSARLLGSFVVAISVGQILAGPIWGQWIDRYTAWVLIVGSILAAVAGCVVLWAEPLHDPAPLASAALFLALSLARQGVMQARIRLVTIWAPEETRPAILALTSMIIACAGLGVAFVLGVAAHWSDVRIPLLVLIALNCGAALYVLELTGFRGYFTTRGGGDHDAE